MDAALSCSCPVRTGSGATVKLATTNWPPKVAVILAMPLTGAAVTAGDVAVKVAEAAPAGTATEAGTVTTFGALLDSVMVAAVGEGVLKVTVNVCCPPP